MAATATEAAKVDALSPGVAKYVTEWAMSEALMDGTPAMRAAGKAYLPKWPNEEDDSWSSRRDTATLFPAFRRTVSVMSGKPFAKEATLSDDAPPEVQGWAEDIDCCGVNLHTFAAEMLTEALAHGLCGILVEAPKPLVTGASTVTRAQQKAAGVRPYWVRVEHGQILGYRLQNANGVQRLAQLRIRETVTVEDGKFGEAQVNRVRVLEPGSWAVYEKQAVAATGELRWVEIESGATGLSYVPFVPVYGSRQGYMDGVSPLRDLAYLNVKHWQSQSDQDTILHIARVPILAVIGGGDSKLTIGAGTAAKLPAGADMKWVEHQGHAIEAGAKSLKDLEDQMIQAGAELLVKRPGQRTATESANDAEANKSDLQRIVEGYEDSLDAALRMMADYASLASAGKVTLFKDFSASNLTDASAQLILMMEEGVLITKETAVREFQRRGTLSADIDPETEVKAAIAQAATAPDPEPKPQKLPPGGGPAHEIEPQAA